MDWESHKEIAYGILELQPEQFWVLTPGELIEMSKWKIKKEQAKDKLELERYAQLAAWLLSPYSQAPLSVDDFIRDPSKIKTKEQRTNDIYEMQSEFGLQ